MSLIDGQQRSWALSELVGKFWTNPWFTFHSPKWDTLAPASGPIAEAGSALDDLVAGTGIDRDSIMNAISMVAADEGREAFDDYAMLIDYLATEVDGWPHVLPKGPRAAVRQLAAALVRQEDMLKELPVPVLLLNEALQRGASRPSSDA